MSADSKRLVVTIWDDQLDNDEYVLIPDGSPSWMALPGAVELKKHVPIALSKGAEVIGVLCHAEDPNASRRVRAYYDEKSLLVLSLEKRGDKVVAVVVGEVAPEVAVNGLVARQASQ